MPQRSRRNPNEEEVNDELVAVLTAAAAAALKKPVRSGGCGFLDGAAAGAWAVHRPAEYHGVTRNPEKESHDYEKADDHRQRQAVRGGCRSGPGRRRDRNQPRRSARRCGPWTVTSRPSTAPLPTQARSHRRSRQEDAHLADQRRGAGDPGQGGAGGQGERRPVHSGSDEDEDEHLVAPDREDQGDQGESE